MKNIVLGICFLACAAWAYVLESNGMPCKDQVCLCLILAIGIIF